VKTVSAPLEVSYAANIQESIFNLSCLVGCHDGSRQAGLELSTWETLMEGGDFRLVIVPGNAEESPLVWSIEGEDALGVPVSLMPPPGLGFPRLNGAEIKLIKDWIDQGANFMSLPFSPCSFISRFSVLKVSGNCMIFVIDFRLTYFSYSPIASDTLKGFQT